MENRDDFDENMFPPQPLIDNHHFWLISSFYDLSTDRALGMSIGPIPYSSILRFIAFWDLEEESADLLIEVVKAMDSLYMKHVNENNSKGKK